MRMNNLFPWCILISVMLCQQIQLKVKSQIVQYLNIFLFYNYLVPTYINLQCTLQFLFNFVITRVLILYILTFPANLILIYFVVLSNKNFSFKISTLYNFKVRVAVGVYQIFSQVTVMLLFSFYFLK